SILISQSLDFAQTLRAPLRFGSQRPPGEGAMMMVGDVELTPWASNNLDRVIPQSIPLLVLVPGNAVLLVLDLLQTHGALQGLEVGQIAFADGVQQRRIALGLIRERRRRRSENGEEKGGGARPGQFRQCMH